MLPCIHYTCINLYFYGVFDILYAQNDTEVADMYINSAYIKDPNVKDLKELYDRDKKNPLSIRSCGNYKLISKKIMPTYRPKGRLDYQLIYVASGITHFYFSEGEDETIIPAGTFVLFRPGDYQRYIYYNSDHTEVFWLHFSGNDVENILKQYGIGENIQIISTGTKISYSDIFKNIIREIQQQEFGYEQMIDSYFRQLLIHISRDTNTLKSESDSYIYKEIELAQQYFDQHYSENINIEEYASSRGMSISWFIRSYKAYTNITPLQYILNRRISNAQILLESTDYPINEISSIVGYDNPLYFSRLFTKQKGVSPRKYKELIKMML